MICRWDAAGVLGCTARAVVRVAALAALLGAVSGCSSRPTSEAPWTLVQSSPSASTVVVQYYHGDCDSLKGAKVTRTTRSVHIRLLIKQTASVCDSAGRTTMVRVRLGSALGSRTVEGACHPAPSSLCQPSVPIGVPPQHLPIVGP